MSQHFVYNLMFLVQSKCPLAYSFPLFVYTSNIWGAIYIDIYTLYIESADPCSRAVEGASLRQLAPGDCNGGMDVCLL
jgi:hypothetical protein